MSCEGKSVSKDTLADKLHEEKTRAITKFTETLRIKYNSEDQDHWILHLQKLIEKSYAFFLKIIENQNEKSTGNSFANYLEGFTVGVFGGVFVGVVGGVVGVVVLLKWALRH